MGKEEITSLELHFLVKELKQSLVGGLIQKIYQYETAAGYQFLFEIYNNGASNWLYFDRNKIFLTKYKKIAPEAPPSFCMFLRKHMMGARITNITQRDFDRVIEIQTGTNYLIIELFSKGNVILCDALHTTIMPFEVQIWKDRSIKPRTPYKYPPPSTNPFATDLGEFRRLLKSQEKKLIAVLATVFGFGKEYADEICLTAKVDGSKLSKDLTMDEVVDVHSIMEKLDTVNIAPVIYTDFIALFPMKSFAGRSPVKKGFATISEAMDDYFPQMEIKKSGEEAKKSAEEKEKRIEKIVSNQKREEERLSKATIETRSAADLIYSNYEITSSILSTINKLLKSGKRWEAIKEAVRKEDTPETGAIKEIREHDGIIVVSLSGQDVELDIKKSVEQNAEKYYEEAKKAKKKLEGVKSVIKQTSSIAKKLEAKEVAAAVPEIKARKKWYEKFKWFMSSSGFLVIAGRDATQNEQVVKKYAEHEDFLFHADIQGAAFVLVKADKKQIDGISMKEASEFSAANSKAWARGIGNVDVYAFRPEQATKPEGSLGKGSFVIQGQRIWFRDTGIKLSIGIKIDKPMNATRIISGPVMAVRKSADYFLTIEPGHKDSLELSREIKNKFLLKCMPEDRYFIDRVQPSDIQIHIPSGRGEIVQ